MPPGGTAPIIVRCSSMKVGNELIEMGRFMSPDPSGGHTEDPQTLNKYSYVGNNPLSRNDPTGLDFYLSCTQSDNKSDASTCATQTGLNGALVRGTTDSNGQFNPTVVTSASLSDSNSGNTALVNGSGVQITTGTGTANQQTSQGIFIPNTPGATIQGDPNAAGWNQFSFNINGSDLGHGVLSSGTATYFGQGGWQGMVQTIQGMMSGDNGPFQYLEESTPYGNPFHPGALNYRFSPGDYPDLFNYGPSAHFPVVPYPTTQVPDFHVDSVTGAAHGPCAKWGIGCS